MKKYLSFLVICCLGVAANAQTCVTSSGSWNTVSSIIYGASNFSITGYSGSSLSDAGIQAATSSSTGYASRVGTIASVNLLQGGSYSSSVTWGTTSIHQICEVWIDFNDDGTFQSSEEVSPISGWNSSTTPQPTTFNISIPSTANPGTHLMRLRAIWEVNATDLGYAPAHVDPCLISYSGISLQYWSGTCSDYHATIIALTPSCTGTPTPGTASVSPLSGGSSTSFTLSLSGTTSATGLTYQWQSSPTGTGSWTNISGATNSTYTYTGISATTYYQCIVTCSGASSTSSVTSATFMACTPSSSSWNTTTTTGSNTYTYTGSVQTWVVPAGVTSVNVDMQGALGGSNAWGSHGGYGGRTQATLPVTPGQTLNIYVGGAGGNYTYSYSYAVGGSTAGGTGAYYSGGGGGASDIRIGGTALSNRMIVAGGGAGAGYNCGSSYEYGGAGGGLTGATGWECSSSSSCYCGSGGTQTAGGAGATCYGSASGSLGSGANGSYSYYYSGAGGGGYYGGGSGAYGGGGGGSNYADPSCTSVTHTQGYNASGNGSVTISWSATYEIPQDGINAIYVTPASGAALNDTGLCALSNSLTGYLNHTSISPIVFYTSGVYASSITWGTAIDHQEAQIWIDFNDNGTFETTEEVTSVVGYNTSATPNPTTFNVSIPSTANPGTHLMRVRGIYELSSYGYTLSSHLDPCLFQYLSTSPEYADGNVIDYICSVVAPCAGTPTAGSAVVSPTNGSSSTVFTLSLSGTTVASGLTYQWQSSPDASTWTNISGATNSTYSFTGISANTYFQCIITCTGYGSPVTTSSALAVLLSCVPTSSSWYSAPSSTTYSYTGSVQTYTVPSGVSSISISATGAQGGNSSYYNGGHGATMTGTFAVTAGHVLDIMVGQQGTTGGGNAGGGGGGSFVWDVTAGNVLLVAAGGGGGGGYSGSSAGVDAVTGVNGTNGVGGYDGGGIGGYGGTVPSSTAGYSYWASGGCGWYSTGNTGNGPCPSYGGVYPLGGGAGGAAGSTSVGAGGYGGGGGASARCGIIGGGGGGGYSGGGPGCDNSSYYQPGGGGGSYNGGTSQVNSVSTGTGNGSVTISYSYGSETPCYGINTFYVTPATGSALSDASICTAANATTGYLSRIGTIAPVTLYQGGSYASSVTWGIVASYQEAQVWIDFNNDGTFATSEEVTAVVGYSTSTTTSPTTFNISIPLTAATGTHTMRIRGIYEYSSTGYALSSHLDPCLLQYLSTLPEYADGDVVDYAVTITAPPACSGTPIAGSASVSPTNGGSSTVFTLSLTGTTLASGLTYQWQSSTDGTTWANISGATAATYTFTGISNNTYFQCIVACSGYSGTSTSSSCEAFLVTCLPTSTSWIPASTTTTYSYIGSVQTWTVPTGVTSITVDMAGAQGGSTVYGSHGGYGGRVQATLPVTPGQTLNIYVGGAGGNYTYSYSYATGGSTAGGSGGYYVGGGGGASDIRIGGTALTNRMIVAGGGGGAGNDCASSSEYGGAGGGLTGAVGWYCSTSSSCVCGSGGTQTSGGLGATCYTTTSGSLGVGGSGTYSYNYSGAGGGGYYGGGSGAYGGGGGGSSYTDASCTSITHTQGYNSSGNGYVILGYTPSSETPCDGVNAFAVTAATGSSLLDIFICTAVDATTGYLSRIGTVAPVTLYQGGTYASSITWGTALSYQEAQVWIDFNNDGTFATSEEVSAVVGYNATSTPNPTTFNISIPLMAPTGNHNMRVRGILESSAYTEGLSTHLDPCLVQYLSTTPEYSNGDVIDYVVNITPPPACTGTPTAGTATVTPTNGGSTTTFTLSLSGTTFASGLTYQWQSSPDGSTWTNISGATTPIYTFSGLSANTFYQCIVGCTGYSGTSTSSTTEAILLSCLPTSSSWLPSSTTTTYSYTGSVQTWTVPTGVTSITVDMAGAQGGSSAYGSHGGYGGRVQATLPVTAGTTLNLYVGGAGSNYSYSYSYAVGGSTAGGSGGYYVGGGGGASDIRIGGTALSNRMIVAGGGGGAGQNCGSSAEYGGAGGGLTGAIGWECSTSSSCYCGSGGTQTAGGSGATCYGSAGGSLGTGGNGTYTYYSSGAGGGGYYGGGSGAYGGGGGGSSYTDASCTSITHTQGYNSSGNGYITLGYTPSSETPCDGVNAFAVTAATGSSLLDIFICTAVDATTGYLSRIGTVAPITLYQGGTYASSITWGTALSYQEAQVWIDFNNDGTFATSEEVSAVVGYNATSTPNPTTFNISIPLMAPTGNHNMRVRGILESSAYTEGLSAHLDPCLVQYLSTTPEYSSGDVVDYVVNITPPPACTGTPTAGTATVTPTNGGSTTTFTLSLSGTTFASGLTYQWQSSVDGTTWTNISGATTPIYSFSGLSANTFYQCIVGCTGYSGTSTSSTTEAFLLSCLPTSSSWVPTSTTSTFSYTGSVQTWTVPIGVTSISVDMAGAQGGSSAYGSHGGYGGRVQATLPVTAGSTLNIYVGGAGGNYTYSYSYSSGGSTAGGSGGYYVGGGGGASDIRIGGTALSNRMIVAGGGGGAGANCNSSSEYGGAGGGLTGAVGWECGTSSTCLCGSGGTQTSGGVGASCYGTSSGSLGTGAGGSYSYNYSGAGGGGYYGGGAGAYGGGGGGSSYTDATCTGVTHTQGYNSSGNGYVTLGYTPSTEITSDGINAFAVTAATGSSLLDIFISSAADASTGYLSRIGTIAPITLYQGGTYASSITWGTVLSYQEAQVWIDFNNDGTFATSEEVSPVVGYNTTTTPNPTTFNISIPSLAATGNHNMRVRGILESSAYTEGLSTHLDPCLVQYLSTTPEYSNGDVVDYVVNITPPPACTGTPTAGTATVTPTNGSSSTTFTLSLSGTTFASALTYQWQSSPDGTTWTNIPAGTTAIYSFSGLSGNTFFQCIVGCSGYSGTSTSTNTEAFLLSCLPTNASWTTPPTTTTTYSYTGSVQTWTVPTGVTSISVDMQGATGGSSAYGSHGGYGGRVQATLPVTSGTTLNIYVGGAGSNYSYSYSYTGGGSTAGGNGGYYVGGGGGASDIRIGGTALTNRMIVAGGGGGAGYNCGSSYEYGGAGGGLTGAMGWECSTSSSCYCGSGGTQTAGGSGATCYSSAGGSLGTGANGSYSYYYSGAGGGGYYGGGSGGLGGGGGGSSYTDATCTSVTHTQGYNGSGNGSVTISYTPTAVTPCDGITSIYITPATGSALSDGSICSSVDATTGYLSRIGTVAPVTLYAGGTYASTITWGTVLNYQEAQIWIDFNNDGIFSTSEEVTPVVGYSTTTTTSPTTFNVTIPLMSPTGNHNMRVRGIYESSSFTQGLSTHLDPCLVQYLSTTPEYADGDVLDYVVNIALPPACTGTPTAGTANVSPGNGGSTTVFTLSLTGTTFASGLTYQWQSSPNGTTWTNITGATTPIYTFTGISANTYYQCIVACTGYSGTSTSTSVEAILMTCYPTSASWYTGPTTTTYSYTGSVQTWTVPTGVTSVTVDMAGATGGSTAYGSHGGYGGRVQATLPVTAGTTLNIYVGGAGGNYTYSYSYASGGSTAGGNGGYYVGGGGGASDIRIGGTALSNRMIVAGGGGGAGSDCNSSSEYGGAGGGLTGAIGWECGTSSSCYCGSGGTQTAGGAGATCYGSAAGSLGTGGNGSYSYNYSGAGGGGYYGGGSGAYGGGGGGSSYTDATCTSVTNTQGYNGSGNGYVTIGYVSGGESPTYGINTIYVTPGFGSPLLDAFMTASASTTTGYLNRTAMTPVNLYQGGTYATSLGWGTATSYQEAQIWIDFNNDGTFSPSEEVTPVVGYSTTSTPNPTGTTISIPSGAAIGNHLMRVRGILEYSGTGYSLSSHLDPCLVEYAGTAPEYMDGDVIDYTVNISAVACTGTPTAGAATASVTAGCSPFSSTISLTGATVAPGITYHWQSSSDGSTWTNITGATSSTYAATVSTAIYYRCVVSCSYSSLSSNSSSVHLTINPLPSLISCSAGGAAGGPFSACGSTTGIVFSDSVSGGTWSNSPTTYGTISSSTGAWTSTGTTGTTTITYTNSCGSATAVFSLNGIAASITGTTNVCVGSNITLSDATIGGTWSSAATSIATVNTSGVVTGISGGTAVISYSLGCGTPATVTVTVNSAPTGITGTTSVCVGSTTSLSDATVGGTWSSSAGTIASVGATTGVVTGASVGTATITYSNGCGTAATTTVTVNASPSSITGTLNVCVGSITTLVDVTVGGTWSSSSTSVATVDAFGDVTGVSQGTTSISYSNGCGTPATAVVTVNALPVSITGTATLCIGGTTSLSETSSGGTWSSTSTTIATVGSTTGVVSGVASGTTVMSYSNGCGSPATYTVTVEPFPTAISGVSSVCGGLTITMTDSVAGGTWSSSDAAIASIGSTTGIVTGVAAGSVTITYTTGCGTVTTSVYVNSASPAAITGPASTCIGGTVTLADVTPGGSWTSGNTAIATITSAGHLTGVSAGIDTITYITGCGTPSTYVVTVNAVPSAITGTLMVCAGSGMSTLSDSISGGTWSSSSTAIATVTGTGIVSGVSGGFVTISYANGCGTATASVTVNSGAPASISGPSIMCLGTPGTLTNSVSGGIWTSGTTSVANINSLSGVVSEVATGTTTITYSTGCGSDAYATITVNAVPSAIGGNSPVCVGSVITLTDVASGGTWTSSTTTVANIGSSAGLLTGVASGTSTITYDNGCGAVYATATVNGTPAPISGTLSACFGTSSSLSDVSTIGVWSSSTTSVATVNAISGIVSALVAGTTNVSYTTACGTSTAIFTVNGLPASITGSFITCVGTSTTLTDSTVGGTWSSSNTGVATVTSGGVVTGVSFGSVVITYTDACGYTTAGVTINSSTPAITGTPTMCLGGTTDLSDATGGGVWSSSNPGIASVSGSSPVVVTGNALGSAIITYTTVYCGFITTTVTVNGTPAAISGAPTVCVSGTTTMNDVSLGGHWSSINPTIAAVDSVTGIVTGLTPGVATIDYTTPCGVSSTTITVNGAPAALTGTNFVCAGFTTVLASTTPGGMWSSGSPTTASVDSIGTVTGNAVGITTLSYTTVCGTASTSFTVNGVPTSVLAIDSVLCIGSMISVSDAVTGGTWGSSNTSVATIGSISGTITGVAAGVDTIIYSTGCGSAATIVITVSPNTMPISGPSTVCVSRTATYSDTVSGGIWSVSPSTIASVTSSGVVTGLMSGTATIDYSNGCGSPSTKIVTVNASPAAISGPPSVCQYSATFLTDISSGGSWSSSDVTFATVNVSGIVSGVAPGSVTISYTQSTGCYVTKLMTVYPFPNAGFIVGANTVCQGSTTSLADTSASGFGLWSSSNTTLATVSGGIVHGVNPGVDTIFFATTNGCGTALAHKTITVNPLPTVASISGSGSVCVGLTATYLDTTVGGVWSSTYSSIATVSPSGVVTAIMPGTDTLKYTVSNSCGSNYAANVITVVGTPASITGISSVCDSAYDTLYNATVGGTWTSSDLGTATISGGVVHGVGSGLVTITYSTGCGTPATTSFTVNPLPNAGSISGLNSICQGTTAVWTETSSGGVWSAVNGNASVSYTSSTSGTVTGISAGVDTITYTVTNSCGVASVSKTVTINSSPYAGTLIGSDSVCVGSTLTLSATSAGGMWYMTNGDASVAAGVVTATTAGLDTVVYKVTSTYCGADSVKQGVAIIPLANAGVISGASNVCVGAVITLTDLVTGGVWSSNSLSVATVTGGGIVGGVSGGVDTIVYTYSNFCGTADTSMVVSVNTLPSAGIVIGADSVCMSSSITLTDAVAGGLWLSTNTSIATVTSGVVTSVSTGLDTIKYEVTNMCGSTVAQKAIFVAPLPSVSMIGGPTALCLGGALGTLTDSVAGGVWSDNTGVVTVTSGGIVSANTFGIDTVNYILTTSCGSTSASVRILVDTTASPTIAGMPWVCMIPGAADTLSATVGGGTWTSTNPMDTITADGILTGGVAGPDTIIYAISNVCGTFTASQVVWVHTKGECDSMNGVKPIVFLNDGVIRVYPNPTIGEFTVELPEVSTKTTIIIMDIYGKEIETKIITDVNTTKVPFELNELSSGTYMIKILSNDRIFRGKIILLGK